MISTNLIRLFLIVTSLFFLSYEIVTFNEEFFIAVSFFSFLLFMKPIFPGLINDFYNEDKNKFFNLISNDINYNSTFFFNFLNLVSLYELKKEFFYQNLNFSLYVLILKFINFYEDFKSENFINMEEKLPENMFLFYDRILGFVTTKLQAKYLDYFYNKWNFVLNNDIITFFGNETGSFLESNQSTEDWIYG